MATKSQDQCFRTFGGERWPNLLDMHGPGEEAAVARLKAEGWRIRVRAHPGGFRQAFVHPEDWTEAGNRMLAIL